MNEVNWCGAVEAVIDWNGLDIDEGPLWNTTMYDECSIFNKVLVWCIQVKADLARFMTFLLRCFGMQQRLYATRYERKPLNNIALAVNKMNEMFRDD